MRIFGKASKPYSQNGELRGHCGADSCAIWTKLSANETSRNFKKAAKGAGAKDQNFIKFKTYFEALGTFICPLRAQLACKTATAAHNL
jgi:hypothetical protein|nr:hypothetical protein [uncultured Campylobacter sp.]